MIFSTIRAKVQDMSEFGLMSFVALDHWEPLDAHSLGRALGAISPTSSFAAVEREAGVGEDALEVEVDGQQFLLIAMPGPLPEPDHRQALQNSLFWPSAASEMARHTAFVVITALDPETAHGLVRAQAVAMTRLAAAVAEEMPSLGLYWRGAEGAVPPGRLLLTPGEFASGKWPADIWIGYVFFGKDTPDDPLIGVQTRGAAAYLGFEVEVPPMPVNPDDRKEPLRILFAAVGHLIAQGHTIRDGQQVQVKGERRTLWQLHRNERGGPGVAQLTLVE